MKKSIFAILIAAIICFAASCSGEKPKDSSSTDSLSSEETSSESSSDVDSQIASSESSEVISGDTTTTSSNSSSSAATTKPSSTTKATTQSATAATSGNTVVVNSLTAAQLDAIPKESNLKKWDIAWAPTPTGTFFDFYDTESSSTAIWRGAKIEASAFDDADWGLIINAFETQDNETPGAYIYNKADVNGMKSLEIIARCNKDSVLSGRGAFRVKAVCKNNGTYVVNTLKINFSDNQKAQTDASFKQDSNGWVTFEAPPKNDKCDSFMFDLSALAGKTDVVFFVEANDRMESGTNLADRVIICAIRME